MATSTSISDALTKFDPAPYPSGDMIKSLIVLLSKAVSSSVVTLSHNTHTLCTAVSRSLEIFNAISTLTKESLEEIEWTSFDKYTALIPPLEDTLLELAKSIGEFDESIGKFDEEKSTDVSIASDIGKWIKVASTWVKNRATIKKACDSLWADDHFKDIAPTISAHDMKLDRNHDDDVFLDELIRDIEERKRGDPNFSTTQWGKLSEAQQLMKGAQSLFKSSSDRDKIMEYAIQLAQVVNGIMEVTSKTTDEKLRNHLGSDRVLDETLKISKIISDSLSGVQSIQDSNFAATWEDYTTLLKEKHELQASEQNKILFPFGELRKLQANIRPPYFIRSRFLISACRNITKAANPNSNTHVAVVQRTASAVLGALMLAANHPLPTESGSPATVLKSNDIDAAYTTALDQVKDSLTCFKVAFDSTEIDGFEPKENSHLTAWDVNMTKFSKDTTTILIEVIVKVKALSDAMATDQKVTVPETATLDTVLWEVCNTISDNEHRKHLKSGYFVGTAGVKIEVSEMVSKLDLEAGVRRVQLTF